MRFETKKYKKLNFLAKNKKRNSPKKQKVNGELTIVNSEETRVNGEETRVNGEETPITSELSTQRKRKKRKRKERKNFNRNKNFDFLTIFSKLIFPFKFLLKT